MSFTNIQDSGHWKPGGTYTFDWIPEDSEFELGTLTLDVGGALPTPADFSVGATLTGSLSGTTCKVYWKQKIWGEPEYWIYIISDLSGDFTDGETISDGINSIACETGYPLSLFPIWMQTAGYALLTDGCWYELLFEDEPPYGYPDAFGVEELWNIANNKIARVYPTGHTLTFSIYIPPDYEETRGEEHQPMSDAGHLTHYIGVPSPAIVVGDYVITFVDGDYEGGNDYNLHTVLFDTDAEVSPLPWPGAEIISIDPALATITDIEAVSGTTFRITVQLSADIPLGTYYLKAADYQLFSAWS